MQRDDEEHVLRCNVSAAVDSHAIFMFVVDFSSVKTDKKLTDELESINKGEYHEGVCKD